MTSLSVSSKLCLCVSDVARSYIIMLNIWWLVSHGLSWLKPDRNSKITFHISWKKSAENARKLHGRQISTDQWKCKNAIRHKNRNYDILLMNQLHIPLRSEPLVGGGIVDIQVSAAAASLVQIPRALTRLI